MKIVFIRHGEPDKAEVDKRGFIGQGRDMAPLTEQGVRQSVEVSSNPLLRDSQLIVSSPYTRALQTAAIHATPNFNNHDSFFQECLCKRVKKNIINGIKSVGGGRKCT